MAQGKGFFDWLQENQSGFGFDMNEEGQIGHEVGNSFVSVATYGTASGLPGQEGLGFEQSLHIGNIPFFAPAIEISRKGDEFWQSEAPVDTAMGRLAVERLQAYNEVRLLGFEVGQPVQSTAVRAVGPDGARIELDGTTSQPDLVGGPRADTFGFIADSDVKPGTLVAQAAELLRSPDDVVHGELTTVVSEDGDRAVVMRAYSDADSANPLNPEPGHQYQYYPGTGTIVHRTIGAVHDPDFIEQVDTEEYNAPDSHESSGNGGKVQLLPDDSNHDKSGSVVPNVIDHSVNSTYTMEGDAPAQGSSASSPSVGFDNPVPESDWTAPASIDAIPPEIGQADDIDSTRINTAGTVPKSGSTYEIRPGDTLSEIAAQSGVSVEELAARNGLDDPDHIRAGADLVIPAGEPEGQADGAAPMENSGRPTGVAGPGASADQPLGTAADRGDADSPRIAPGADGLVDPAGLSLGPEPQYTTGEQALVLGGASAVGSLVGQRLGLDGTGERVTFSALNDAFQSNVAATFDNNAFTDGFDDFGADLRTGFTGAGVGLVGAELSESLGFDGDSFGDRLGSAVTEQALATGFSTATTTGAELSTALQGMNFSSLGAGVVMNELTGALGLGAETATGAMLSSVGAAVGSVIPGVGTVIGSFVGSALGSALGDLFGDDEPPPPPQAWAEIGVDTHGYFTIADTGDAHGGNGGGMAVAVQQVADTLNGLLETSGGQWLHPGAFESMRLGYDGDGIHANGRSVDSVGAAVERLVLDQLDGAAIEGGDVYVRRAIHGNHDDLDGLLDAVSTAQQYGAIQGDLAAIEALADDPAVAAELDALACGELATGDLSANAGYVAGARALAARADALGLDEVQPLDHASRLNAAFDAAGIDLAGVVLTDLVVALGGGRLTVAIADPERPDAAIRELDHAELDWHAQSPGAAMLYLDDGSGIDLAGLLERTGVSDAIGTVHVGEALAACYGATGEGGDMLLGLGRQSRLAGGPGDDIFVAGVGGDTLTGGAGHDSVDYGASETGVHVDLATGMGRGGLATGDTYRDIEGVAGSAGDDALVGNDDGNHLEGDAGDDLLVGGGGDDTLIGGDGADHLGGGDGRDRVAAGTGDDVLDGGGGRDDALLGGDGNDTFLGRGDGDLLRGGAGIDAALYEGSRDDWNVSRHGEAVFVEHGDGSGDPDRLVDVEAIRFGDTVVDLSVPRDQEGLGGEEVVAPGATRRGAQRDARAGTHWGEAAAIGLVAAGYGEHHRAADDVVLPSPASSETWHGTPPGGLVDAATGLAVGGGSDTSSASAALPIIDMDDLAGSGDGGAGGGPPAIGATTAIPGNADEDPSIRPIAYGAVAGSAVADDAVTVEDDPEAESTKDPASEPSEPGPPPIIGTLDDDVLTVYWTGRAVFGLAGDDLIISNAKGLYIEGGPGVDTVSYVNSPAGIDITLDGGRGQGGYAEHDRLLGIERAYGSHHDDRIVSGLEHAVELHGLGGDNVLIGGGGDDVLYGADGDDALHAGAGDNELYGGAGDNVFHSGPGLDLMVGGAGNDTFRIHAGDDLAFIDGAGGTNGVHISGAEGVTMDLTLAGNVHRVKATAGDDTLTLPVDAEWVEAGAGHDRARLNAGLDDFAVTLDHEAGEAVLARGDGSAMTVRAEEIELEGLGRTLHTDGRNNAPYARDTLLGGGMEDIVYAFSAADLIANDLEFDRGDHLTLDSVAGIDVDLTRALDETYWSGDFDGIVGDNVLVADTGDNSLIGDGRRVAAVFDGRLDEFDIHAESDRLIVDHTDGKLGRNTLHGLQTLSFTDHTLHIGEADARQGIVRVDSDGLDFEPAANVNRDNYEGGRDGLPARPGVPPPGFDYRVRDEHGALDRADAVIDFEPVNDAPELGPGEASYQGWFRTATITSPDYSSGSRGSDTGTRYSYWEAEGSGRVLGVDVEDTGNAIGGTGSDLTYRLVSAPDYGRITLNESTGTFEYSLNQGGDAPSFSSTITTSCNSRGGHCTTSTTYTLIPEQDEVSKSEARNLSFDVEVLDSNGKSSGAHRVDLANESPGGGGGKKPLALDLQGNGLDFVDTDDSDIIADINGDGSDDVMAWVAEGTGLLTIDRDGSGDISGFDEISFVDDHPDARTDLEGLALAFDSNADGVLDPADDRWGQFAVWHDADSNGIEDAGERQGLDEAGIAAISLQREGGFEEQGDVTLFGTGDFEWTDGRIGTFGDVAFHFRSPKGANDPDAGDGGPEVADDDDLPPPSADELAGMAAHAAARARATSRDEGDPGPESGSAAMMVATMEEDATTLEISSTGG